MKFTARFVNILHISKPSCHRMMECRAEHFEYRLIVNDGIQMPRCN